MPADVASAGLGDYLAHHGYTADQVDKMRAAWTKSVMLHGTLWTRSYVPAENC